MATGKKKRKSNGKGVKNKRNQPYRKYLYGRRYQSHGKKLYR